MGPIGCPETSVRNCHYLLRNNPEERSSQLYRMLESGTATQSAQSMGKGWTKKHLPDILRTVQAHLEIYKIMKTSEVFVADNMEYEIICCCTSLHQQACHCHLL